MIQDWIINKMPTLDTPVSSLMPTGSRQWIPNRFSAPVSNKDFSTVITTVWYCEVWLFGCSARCYFSFLLGYSHCYSNASLTARLPLLQKGLYCQFTLSNHWASALLCWGSLAPLPSTGLKQQCLTPGVPCVSVTELTCHPSCQPFQQRLFHPGGHIPEVFPAHRRKCPSPTFFKSWGSHPFPDSQVMATVSGANCGNSADKMWLVGTKSLTSRKHLHTSICMYFLHRNSDAVFGYSYSWSD